MTHQSALSYRWARYMDREPMGWIWPLLLTAIGLYLVGMYLLGVTEDSAWLGFGVANLVVAWHLFTVRGFQLMLRERDARIRRLERNEGFAGTDTNG